MRLALATLTVWAALPAAAFSVLTRGADDAPIVVDGRLDEPVWRRAPLHTDFAQLQPTAGGRYPEDVRTQVQVVADDRALVIGVRAWSAQAPRVLLSRRDAVQRDQDMIGVWIDTGGRGESAMFVKASLFGVVTDGLYRAADDEEDLGPDFPVSVAAALLPDGYSMEIRWPLAALRYPYQARRPWRLVVGRALPQASDLFLVSGRADADALNFLHASEPLRGLDEVLTAHRDRAEGDLIAEWTGRAVRSEDRTERRGSASMEGWWRPRADWLVNATLNPDFAQVDVDAPQNSGNRAVALAQPEKRRYFLESADVLGLPLSGFYSRTVADPRWGARATWRGVEADATLLLAEDRAGTVVTRGRPWRTDEWTLSAPSVSQILRNRWQFGHTASEASDGADDGAAGHGALTLGTLLSRRSLDAARHAQLAGVDGVWRHSGDGRHWQAQWSLMASEHSLAVDADGRVLASPGPSRRDGSAWTRLLHSDEQWFNQVELKRIGPDFVNLLGFVDQAGLWQVMGDFNRRLGEQTLPGGAVLHQSEWHLGLLESRSLRDTASGEPGGEVVRRELRTGFWFSTAGRTQAWLHAGWDRQRARSGGALHDTPALHAGLETTPVPWLTRLTAEGSLGQQLDSDLDRVGRGGWWSVQASTRWALPRGWSLEIDPVFTGTRIAGSGPYPSLDETGVRLLAMLHLSPQQSLRLIAQNERSARGTSASQPALVAQNRHRSVMWKQRFSPRYQLALGAQWDRPSDRPPSRELFVKWEAALGG